MSHGAFVLRRSSNCWSTWTWNVSTNSFSLFAICREFNPISLRGDGSSGFTSLTNISPCRRKPGTKVTISAWGADSLTLQRRNPSAAKPPSLSEGLNPQTPWANILSLQSQYDSASISFLGAFAQRLIPSDSIGRDRTLERDTDIFVESLKMEFVGRMTLIWTLQSSSQMRHVSFEDGGECRWDAEAATTRWRRTFVDLLQLSFYSVSCHVTSVEGRSRTCIASSDSKEQKKISLASREWRTSSEIERALQSPSSRRRDSATRHTFWNVNYSTRLHLVVFSLGSLCTEVCNKLATLIS